MLPDKKESYPIAKRSLFNRVTERDLLLTKDVYRI
jgi:hypothetical protein